jgi:hypothetical protein
MSVGLSFCTPESVCAEGKEASIVPTVSYKLP